MGLFSIRVRIIMVHIMECLVIKYRCWWGWNHLLDMLIRCNQDTLMYLIDCFMTCRHRILIVRICPIVNYHLRFIAMRIYFRILICCTLGWLRRSIRRWWWNFLNGREGVVRGWHFGWEERWRWRERMWVNGWIWCLVTSSREWRDSWHVICILRIVMGSLWREVIRSRMREVIMRVIWCVLRIRWGCMGRLLISCFRRRWGNLVGLIRNWIVLILGIRRKLSLRRCPCIRVSWRL